VSASADQALDFWANDQESAIAPFQQFQDERHPCSMAERAQQRYGAPHRRECGRTRQKATIFLSVERRKQCAPVDRTLQGFCLRRVDEFDRAAPVEPTHPSDLSLTERTSAIVPDNQFGHGPNIGIAVAIPSIQPIFETVPQGDRPLVAFRQLR